MSKPLAGRVAVVAGATRGAGRGIARMLGEAGATVYCSGRSSRTQPKKTRDRHAGRPETIEETAEMVTAAGGIGIGPPATWKTFLKETPTEGRAFFDVWIWPHIVTSWHAAPVMVNGRSGLIVELVEHDQMGYHGAFYFDLMETMLKRMIYALANELGRHGVTSVAIGPGFMRTEAILEGFGVTEANWRDALDKPDAKAWGWGGSETPCFVGRAVAALAADPDVARKNGGIFSSWDLSHEYGFSDIDGRRPDRAVLTAAFEEAKTTFLAPLTEAARFTTIDWQLARKEETPA